MLVLSKKEIEESSSYYIGIKECVKLLNITSDKLHLTEKEFLNALNLLKEGEKNEENFIRINLLGYKKTIEFYKTIKEWEDSTKKIISKKKSYSNNIYYNIMLLSKRINIGFESGIRFKEIAQTLTDEEINKIIYAGRSLKFADTSIKRALININRLLLATRKNLIDISEDDLYKLRRVMKNATHTKCMFYILKYLGVFSSNSQYNCAIDREYTYNKKVLKSISIELRNTYTNFRKYDKLNSYIATSINRERAARQLLNWLYDEYPEIEAIDCIEFKHIKEYSFWMKTVKKPNGSKVYSDTTINGKLSHLRNGFLRYLKKEKLLKLDTERYLFGSTEQYSDLYLRDATVLPEPISLLDRKEIERIIYSKFKINNKIFHDMIILLYQLALRPSELLSLKLDCIKGIDELPQLHVHRGKFFKERYIPLTQECLNIIKRLQKYNDESLPIFMVYDGLTVKRLFHDKGVVANIKKLEDYFSNLLIENSLVDIDNKSKYTLYVLRRLRITIWLEEDISEEIVARLVGHSDVDSHNYYIVSKEARVENARKAYEKFYKEFFAKIEIGEDYVYEIETDDEEDFETKLKKSLLEIQNKNINKMVLESIANEFPEYALPVSCGVCIAKAFEDDFECELMNLVCLECKELIDNSLEIAEFDKLTFRIYSTRNIQVKKGIEGLVEKSDSILSRLKKFYVIKFKLNEDDVENRFNDIEKSSIIKRGRKKKV